MSRRACWASEEAPVVHRPPLAAAGKGGRSADGRRAGSGSTTVDKSIAQQQERTRRRDRAADGECGRHDAELTRKGDNGRPADARQSAGAVSRRPLIRVVCMTAITIGIAVTTVNRQWGAKKPSPQRGGGGGAAAGGGEAPPRVCGPLRAKA